MGEQLFIGEISYTVSQTERAAPQSLTVADNHVQPFASSAVEIRPPNKGRQLDPNGRNGNMMIRKMILTATLLASASVALPSTAFAGGGHGWHRHHDHGHGRWHRDRRHNDDGYYAAPRRYYSDDRPRRCRSGNGTTGLILGGAAGALLGREVDRYGDRTPGTIVGAGAGALIGREIDRNRC